MTLDEAVSAITATVPLLASVKPDPADEVEITSGGKRASARDPEPALYVSRDLAADAFVREVKALLRHRQPTGIVFLDGPHMDRFEITMTDKRRTQRTADSRFCVTARIGMVFGPKAAPEPFVPAHVEGVPT